jgi:hypothetical protein
MKQGGGGFESHLLRPPAALSALVRREDARRRWRPSRAQKPARLLNLARAQNQASCWLPPWRPPSPSPVRWPPPLPWPRPRSTCRTPPSTGSATRQQVHRDPGRPARALLLRRRRPRLLRLLRAGGRPLPLRGCEPAQARRPDLPAAAGLHHPGAAQVEPNRGPAVLRLRPRRVVSHVELVYRKGGTGPRIAVSASHSGGPPVNFHRIRYQGLVKVGRVVR